MDYIISGEMNNPKLNVLIEIVRSKIMSGQPYVSGGLIDQPYFLVAYVEPWVRSADNALNQFTGNFQEQLEQFNNQGML